MVYGSDDLALEKQHKLNSLNDEINILQKKYDREKAEALDIERYQKKMAGETEVDISINETKREILENKAKHKELLNLQRVNIQERDTYLKAVQEH